MKPTVTGLKIVAIGLFLYAANTENKYEFYEILRWSILGLFSYFSLISYKEEKTGLLVFFLFGAVLFNPFKHPDFEYSTWRIVDYIFASVTIFSVITDIPINSIKINTVKLRKYLIILKRESLYLLKPILLFCLIISVIATRNYYFMSKHRHVNKLIDEVNINISQLPTDYNWKIYQEAQKIFQVEYSVNDVLYTVGVNDTNAFKNNYKDALQISPPQHGHKYLIKDNVTRNIYTNPLDFYSKNSVLSDCLAKHPWNDLPLAKYANEGNIIKEVVEKKTSWADIENKTPESKIHWEYIEKEARKSILNDILIFYLIPYKYFEVKLLDKYYSILISNKISHKIDEELVKKSVGYSAEIEKKSKSLRKEIADLKNESSRLFMKCISLNDSYFPILLLVIGITYLFRVILYFVKPKTVKNKVYIF